MHRRRFRVSIAALAAACAFAAGARAAAPTEAEFDALGGAIARAVEAQDGVAFADRLDVDGLLSRVFRNVRSAGAKDVEAGMRRSLRAQIESLPRQLPKGSEFRFLHHRKTADGQDRLTCRDIGPLGLNYWEFVVDADASATKFVDIYFASTGELFSQTMQRLVLRALPLDGRPMTPADLKEIKDYESFAKAARAGDWAATLAQYATLPDRYRKDKSTQVMRLMAAIHTPDAPGLLDRVASEFTQQFGDDPAGDLMLIDAYDQRKQYDACDACLDRLDKSVGGDPFLGKMAVNLRLSAKDFDGAKVQATAWQARYPRTRDGIESMLDVALQTSDFDAAVRWMKAMEASPDFTFRFADDLNDAAIYAEFKKSPQYQSWLAARANPATTNP